MCLPSVCFRGQAAQAGLQEPQGVALPIELSYGRPSPALIELVSALRDQKPDPAPT